MKTVYRSFLKVFAVPLITMMFGHPQASEAAHSNAGQWIVVTAPALRSALEPLIDHRQKEGFTVTVLETTQVLTKDKLREGDGSALQNRIATLCKDAKTPNLVLLVGGMIPPGTNEAGEAFLPPLRGVNSRMKDLPTDHGYGLPGDDGLSSVAVGRFPARTAEEARQMVRKTLAFEQERHGVDWRNRLAVLIGNPGGGPLAEMFVQQKIGPRLAMLDPVWEARTVYHASSSRYFAPGERLREVSRRYLEDGEMFSIYLGHSMADGLRSERADFISRDDWSKINIAQGNGVFFTCGCFSCQTEGADDEGYAFAAMRNPSGPVAVIGASGESYSAPGQLAMDGLLNCLAKAPFPTRLGEYWLSVQSGLARGKIDKGDFSLYDQFDGSRGTIPLEIQRLEHLEMWMLLGDPALALPLVRNDITLETTDLIKPGSRIAVKGELPKQLANATVRITLERPVNSTPLDRQKLPDNTPEKRAERERVIIENLERANTLRLAVVEVRAQGNRFTAELESPATLPWTNLIVRASAIAKEDSAMGVSPVAVYHPPAITSPKH